jgi:hypothetical protein
VARASSFASSWTTWWASRCAKGMALVRSAIRATIGRPRKSRSAPPAGWPAFCRRVSLNCHNGQPKRCVHGASGRGAREKCRKTSRKTSGARMRPGAAAYPRPPLDAKIPRAQPSLSLPASSWRGRDNPPPDAYAARPAGPKGPASRAEASTGAPVGAAAGSPPERALPTPRVTHFQ